MQVLNRYYYQVDGAKLRATELGGPVTRETVDALMDAGALQIKMGDGKWRAIVRNGRTLRWKRDPNRIRIPYKHGLYGHGVITEADFVEGE